MRAVSFTRSALKDLKRHANVAPRIRQAIGEYAADPQAHANNVTLLTVSSAKQMRVGDYRVIVEESATAIVVTKIGPRGGVYG
jgi:mRNA-degrading endonuclease RelE of RelBE toxin-antitoxin system